MKESKNSKLNEIKGIDEIKLNKTKWTRKEYNELIEYLKEISDKKYKEFCEKYTPNIYNFLGIKIPVLRKIAKEIAKGNFNEYLKLTKNDYQEEILIHGFVIRYIKLDYISKLKLIQDFLPDITSWGICDSFCTNFKEIEKSKENKEDFLMFLKECIKTNKEYYIRFSVVMLKVMYLTDEYINEVLNILDNILHEGYYVKMAVAWTLCDCYIKYKEKTMKYLENNKLDKFTYNKALQKIIESNCVDKEAKELIKKMKR